MNKNFQAQEQELQRAFLRREEFAGITGFHDRTFQFLPGKSGHNLLPLIRDEAVALFDHSEKSERIQWHRYAGHGCSSQACCVNFLLPLADDAVLLSSWVDHVAGVSGAEVIPIEQRHGKNRLIAFEWFPAERDYLNEAAANGSKTRGANSTSVDAAIKYRLGSETRLLLIEWKYIESYGDTRSANEREGDPTRSARYSNRWKRPHGPLREDIADRTQEVPLELEDFFFNPWYQLLRQQLLAYHVEADPLSDIAHAMLVHVSPGANAALKRINGPRFRAYAAARGLADAPLFEVFADMLDPHYKDRFRSISTEDAFAPLWEKPATEPWRDWLLDRYPSLFRGQHHR